MKKLRLFLTFIFVFNLIMGDSLLLQSTTSLHFLAPDSLFSKAFTHFGFKKAAGTEIQESLEPDTYKNPVELSFSYRSRNATLLDQEKIEELSRHILWLSDKKDWIKILVDRLRQAKLIPYRKSDREYLEAGWNEALLDKLETNLPAALKNAAKKLSSGKIKIHIVQTKRDPIGFLENAERRIAGRESQPPPTFAHYLSYENGDLDIYISERFFEKYGKSHDREEVLFFKQVLFHEVLEAEIKELVGERLKHPIAVALEPLIEPWHRGESLPEISLAQRETLKIATQMGLTDYLASLTGSHPLDYKGLFAEEAAKAYFELVPLKKIVEEEVNAIDPTWISRFGYTPFVRLSRFFPVLKGNFNDPFGLNIQYYISFIDRKYRHPADVDLEYFRRHLSAMKEIISSEEDLDAVFFITEVVGSGTASSLFVDIIKNSQELSILASITAKATHDNGRHFLSALRSFRFLLAHEGLEKVANTLLRLAEASGENSFYTFWSLERFYLNEIKSCQDLESFGMPLANMMETLHFTVAGIVDREGKSKVDYQEYIVPLFQNKKLFKTPQNLQILAQLCGATKTNNSILMYVLPTLIKQNLIANSEDLKTLDEIVQAGGDTGWFLQVVEVNSTKITPQQFKDIPAKIKFLHELGEKYEEWFFSELISLTLDQARLRIQEIKGIQIGIRSGSIKFDIHNDTHVLLHYPDFKEIMDRVSKDPWKGDRSAYFNLIAIKKIEEIKAAEKGNAATISLPEDTIAQIHYAAFEALKILELVKSIRERAPPEKEIIVVPNLSYGRFAVSAIEEELRQLNAKIIYARVGSTESHHNPFVLRGATSRVFIFNDTVLGEIIRNQAIVVAVDGTAHVVARNIPGRPADDTAARYPDAHQAYRNLVIALNDYLFDEDTTKYQPVLESFGKDEQFVQELRATPDYQKLKTRLERIVPKDQRHKNPVGFHFWNPAGMQMIVREDKKKAGDVPCFNPARADLSNPFFLFVNSTHPETPRAEYVYRNAEGQVIEERPGSLDDTDHIALRFRVGLRGLEPSDEIFDEVRKAFLTVKKQVGNREAAQPQKKKDDVQIQLAAFDLDNTLAELDQPIANEIRDKIIRLLQMGTHVAIVTADHADNMERRVWSHIPADLRKNLHFVTNSGAIGFGFDSIGNKTNYFKRGLPLEERRQIAEYLEPQFGAEKLTHSREGVMVEIERKGRYELAAKVEQWLKDRGISASVFLRGRHHLQIVKHNKGEGLKWLAQHHRIAAENVMTVGDSTGRFGIDRALVTAFPEALNISVGREHASLQTAEVIQSRARGIAGTSALLDKLISGEGVLNRADLALWDMTNNVNSKEYQWAAKKAAGTMKPAQMINLNESGKPLKASTELLQWHLERAATSSDKMKALINRLRAIDFEKLPREYAEAGWDRIDWDQFLKDIPLILKNAANKLSKGKIQIQYHERFEEIGFYPDPQSQNNEPPVFAFWSTENGKKIINVTNGLRKEALKGSDHEIFLLQILFHEVVESELSVPDRLKHPIMTALEPLIEDWQDEISPAISVAQKMTLEYAAQNKMISYLEALEATHPFDFGKAFHQLRVQLLSQLRRKAISNTVTFPDPRMTAILVDSAA